MGKKLIDMKKILAFIIVTIILVYSMILSVSASEIIDDVLIPKTLMNGKDIQVHSNPYIKDGITELEFGIIEKMRETATETGFDINIDNAYQSYEEFVYKQLFYSGDSAINAEQINSIYGLIEECGDMLKAKVEEKISSENTINEGFYTGITEEERDEIRKEVFDDYAMGVLKDIGILNINIGFEPYEDIYQLHSYMIFNCNKDVVEGNNYLVEAIGNIDTAVYESMTSYFDGKYSMEEIKTYPENNKLLTKVTTNLVTVGDFDNIALYFLEYDGTVEELDYYIDETSHLVIEIDKCGYIAWGNKKEITSTEVPKDTPNPTPIENNIVTPTPDNATAGSGKVVAPQTGDSENLVTLILSILSSCLIIVCCRKSCKQ